MRKSTDSLDALCQSLYGREAVDRDYSPYVRPVIVTTAADVIDQLDSLLTNREQFIRLLGITDSALVDGMRELIDWTENEAQPALLDAAETLEKAAGEIEMRDRQIGVLEGVVDASREIANNLGREIDTLEDEADSADSLISMAADRIESDGRYIEELEADVTRLEYYKRLLCFSPPSKMVMTPDGACGMPEIEKVYEVIDERNALRKELAKTKFYLDEVRADVLEIKEITDEYEKDEEEIS